VESELGQPVERSALLVDRVAERLRAAILAGDLRPGQHLSVPELARTLDTSRTPVREALYALERAGLVEVRPRRGAVVFGGGPGSLREMLELREALDGMAARLAAERMTAAERTELKIVGREHDAALVAGDVERHLALDLQFHNMIRDGAHNQRLADDVARLRDQIVLVMRAWSLVPGGMGAGTRRDHRAILRAVVSGDGDAAESAARAHVRHIAAFVALGEKRRAAGAVAVR
jgi:DNA-binding GntR family transcriptional regulator